MKNLNWLYVCLLSLMLLFGCSAGEEKPATKGPVPDSLAKEWTSATDVVYEVTKDNFEQTLKPLHQASIRLVDDKIVIESSGADPYLQTDTLDLSKPGKYLLRVVMEVPGTSPAQFFFGGPGRPFTEEESKTVNSVQGKNQIIVQLPNPATLSSIRFDPGTLPGKYIIHEFAIKRIPQ